MRKAPAYVIISLVFFIFIGVGFAYSYFFYPNDHPIDCAIKAATGKDCPSCGFSRAFSNYTHFNFTEGKIYNALSWPVFLFFSFQFFLRGNIVFYFFKTRHLISKHFIIAELIISISFFLFAFLPLLLKF
ncbi:MAG: DUF2752 domain-containing protein [Bacteroidetes bacterium]|nr:DUF2752 domain-containing protein [Bacteroidota bacterium]